MPANTGFWGGISCILGRHVRSRGQAHATPGGWISRCSRCAIPMARSHGGGKWQVVKTPNSTNPDSAERTDEVFAKAIERSRNAGKRGELKAAKAADREIAAEKARGRTSKPHVALAEELAEMPAPARKRRGIFFWRKVQSMPQEDAVESDTPPAG